MPIRVIVHVINEEPFGAEIEELPEANATIIHLSNVRTRDNKQVKWLSGPTQAVLYSMARITFIEIPIAGNPVEGFVRDQNKHY